MPRDSNGTFSLVPGTIVNTGDTVLPSQHNPGLTDIASALTGSLARNGVGGMLANLPFNGFRATGLGDGVADQDAATVAQLNSQGLPIGAVIDYAGSTAPVGWLLCFGQAVSRTTFADLFAAIGTDFGIGDGSTTFNLPDDRGRGSAGRDDMGGTPANRLTGQTAVGGTLGAESVTLTTAQIPSHTHPGTTEAGGDHLHTTNYFLGNPAGGQAGAPADTGTLGAPVPTSVDGNHSHGFTTGATGGGAAHSNVQPTTIYNRIIKTGVV